MAFQLRPLLYYSHAFAVTAFGKKHFHCISIANCIPDSDSGSSLKMGNTLAKGRGEEREEACVAYVLHACILFVYVCVFAFAFVCCFPKKDQEAAKLRLWFWGYV